MTHQEILEKAIGKAIDGGWDYSEFDMPGGGHFRKSHERFDEYTKEFIADWDTRWHCYELIFNHDFAKGLWGEQIMEVGLWKLSEGPIYYQEYIGEGTGGDHWAEGPAYLMHLHQMVIADDPIKYLEEHI